MTKVKHFSELVERAKQEKKKKKASIKDQFIKYVEDVIVSELQEERDFLCICSNEHPAPFLETAKIDVKTVENMFSDIFDEMGLGENKYYEFAVFTCCDKTIGWSFQIDVDEKMIT